MSQDPQDCFYSSPDGLRLYYRRFGVPHRSAGRCAVLCLPGLTRNSRDFAPLALHLAAQRVVLTPDLRGRGQSAYDHDWLRYQPETYLGDLWALLEHEELGRAIVIGTSLGGLLAMMMAATRPSRIAAIVLNDIGPEVARDGVARISTYVGRLPGVASWEEAATQIRQVNGQALPGLTAAQWLDFARQCYREGPDGRPVLDMDPAIGDAVRHAAGGAAPDLWPLWQAIGQMPTLAIRGADSDILTPETFDRMAREHGHLERIEVPGRGHAPLLDEPSALAAIDRFIERHP
jgi:pimeloyl-ACP methyl ester carboxylesterase